MALLKITWWQRRYRLGPLLLIAALLMPSHGICQSFSPGSPPALPDLRERLLRNAGMPGPCLSVDCFRAPSLNRRQWSTMPCITDGCRLEPHEPVADPSPPVPCMADGCRLEPREPVADPSPPVPCMADGCPLAPREPEVASSPPVPCMTDGCPVVPPIDKESTEGGEPAPKPPPKENDLDRQDKTTRCRQSCMSNHSSCVGGKQKSEGACDLEAYSCQLGCI